MATGNLQARLNPPAQPRAFDVSDAKVNTPPKAVDSNAKDNASFKDILLNSNADTVRQRAAQKNGDLNGAKSDEEFARLMMDKLNKENLRKPQNNLDKDAFLKLFVTQMQNQDPLNPQESTEMASQLAQFHGLEQMLNVNKNLEKMTQEQATSRAVSLIDFVGKDVRLAGGKLKLADGKLGEATFDAERDIPNATLEVRDAAGVVVGIRTLGTLPKGEHPLDWDGLTDKGETVPNGIYTFNVSGKDMQNSDVPVKITSNVRITGVDLTDQSGGAFYTELGKVRVNEIQTVGQTGFSKAADTVNPAAAAKKAGEEVTEDAASAAASAAAIESQPTQAQKAAAEQIKRFAAAAGEPPETAPAAASAARPAAPVAAESDDKPADPRKDPMKPLKPEDVKIEFARAGEPSMLPQQP